MSEEPTVRSETPYVLGGHADDAGEEAVDESHEPRVPQGDIIESDAYPMRVLAGAGTGKTFTMVEKIERVLTEVPPDEVLALTFTNKAADSMQDKLAERIGQPAYDIDATTYHSIAYDIVSEYAYEVGVDPDFDVASKAEQFAIVYQVLDDVPYRFIAPSVSDLDDRNDGIEHDLYSFITECKQRGITPRELRGEDGYLPTADRLLALRDHIEDISAIADEQLGPLKRMRKLKPERLDTLDAGLASVDERLEAVDADLRYHEGQSDEKEATMEDDLGRYVAAMRRFIASYREMIDERREELEGTGMTGVLKYPLYVFGALGSDGAIPDSVDPVCITAELDEFITSCMAAHDLVEGFRRYETVLDEKGYLDLQDLIVHAATIAGDPDVGTALDRRWSHVFCDEFQDTDPIQFDLVESLVGDGNLFVVGDDDQAIYEWRGANVENVRSHLESRFGAAEPAPITEKRERARSGGNDDRIHRTPHLLGSDHDGVTDFPLEENFRSVQPILDLANNAIEELSDRGSEKTLRSVGDNADATEGVYTVDAAEDDDRAVRQVVNAIRRIVTGATDVVDTAKALGDVAVLARTNDDVQRLSLALDAAGIPYEIAGGMAAHSTGVDTVIAYLKALAEPRDDVSHNRLLRLRYRLREPDMIRLNRGSEPVSEALLTAEREDGYADWESVHEAKKDLLTLRRRRDGESLSRLYAEIKSVTDIEWYLTQREREDLSYLDEIVSAFQTGSIQPELTTGFIEYLRTHASTVRDSGGVNAQPDTSSDAVNILTVHKSKGLEFDTVLLPHLHQWGRDTSPRGTERTFLETYDGRGLASNRELAASGRAEQRRLLHVAITRAENRLVLFGRGGGSDGESDGQATEYLLDGVPEASETGIAFAAQSESFDPWRTIQRSLPNTARNGTDSLATHPRSDRLEEFSETDRAEFDPTDPSDGPADHRTEFGRIAEQIVTHGRRMVAGELATVDLPSVGVSSDAVVDRTPPYYLRKHSYSSLSMYENCPREYYLRYVVGAPSLDPGSRLDRAEPQLGNAGTSGDVSRRTVGNVFHDTAEEVAMRCLDPELGGGGKGWPLTEGQWLNIARRRSNAKPVDTETLFEQVSACIETFLAIDGVYSWRPRAAEHRFELPLALPREGREYAITGVIDAVFERPDGSMIILDYKTGVHEPDAEDRQLDVYSAAAAELFPEPIDYVGYAHLNDEIDRDLDLQPARDLESIRETLKGEVLNASETEYIEETPGPHCRTCSFTALPCYAPDAE